VATVADLAALYRQIMEDTTMRRRSKTDTVIGG